MLINESFIPTHLKDSMALYEKYEYLKNMYDKGHTYILLNNISVFAPFPKPDVAWDISDVEKIAIYNPEVAKVNEWIKTRIIINLASIDYRTRGVLTRIATGMLNKCDIPKDISIMLHDNMVKNIELEGREIMLSLLPFLRDKRNGDSYSPSLTIQLVTVTSLKRLITTPSVLLVI